MKRKVVILREIPKIAETILEKKFIVDVNRSKEILTREKLYRRVKGASAIISLLTDRIDQAVLSAAGPNLKIVANYAVGYDNLDLDACKASGVIVTNTPGQLTESVGEFSVALLLAVSRRITEADEYVRAGRYKKWEPLMFYGSPMLNKTLGIIGAGRIGTSLAKICHNGFQMKIIYHDLQPNYQLERELGAQRESLNFIFQKSDVISLHVPLSPTTKHLVGKKELWSMKPNAILLNTARGKVINEKYLVQALQKKIIFGAGIDVFENEPKLHPGLRKLKNVVLTPHIASATETARNQMAEIAARNVIAVLSGKKPINPII